MVPVIQEHHTEILIVIGRGRTVNDNSSKDALPSLQSEVGVVPRRTVLRSSPGVSDLLSGCSWTLRDRYDTVLVIGVVLADTVPMYACAIL